MITKKETNDCVYRPNKEQEVAQIKKQSTGTIYYKNHPNPQSENDLLTTEDKALAKKNVDGGYETYYIKSGRSGFHNPSGMYNESSIPGMNAMRFEQVNERVFAYYIQFLMTNLESYLQLAERERS